MYISLLVFFCIWIYQEFRVVSNYCEIWNFNNRYGSRGNVRHGGKFHGDRSDRY